MNRKALFSAFVLVAALFAACQTDSDEAAYIDESQYADAYDGGYDAGPEGAYEAGYQGASMQGNGAPRGSQSAAADGRIAILDHGLRMTRGTQVVPANWQLTQNIATDPNTGQFRSYVLDVRGPSGELVRNFGIANFAQMMGTSFGPTWQGMIQRGLAQEVQGLSFGELRRSANMAQLSEFQRVAQMVRQRGMEMQVLEAPLRGQRSGQTVEGVAYVILISSPQMPGAGTVQASAVVSSPELVSQTVRTNLEMAETYRPNPDFEQRIQQIHAQVSQRQQAMHQQRMANSQSLHQQRMASNQASFDAHQRMMNDRYASNDQQNQQWLESFRNDNSSAYSSGGDYTGHDAFIDGIYEQSTFQDPYSGHQVSRDGQYDNWYTDGLGDYYGTDDPNFNPNSMEGNWEQIEPLQP